MKEIAFLLGCILTVPVFSATYIDEDGYTVANLTEITQYRLVTNANGHIEASSDWPGCTAVGISDFVAKAPNIIKYKSVSQVCESISVDDEEMAPAMTNFNPITLSHFSSSTVGGGLIYMSLDVDGVQYTLYENGVFSCIADSDLSDKLKTIGFENQQIGVVYDMYVVPGQLLNGYQLCHPASSSGIYSVYR